MDQFDAPNITPDPAPKTRTKRTEKINVIRAYQFIFDSPNSTMNIVWATLCMIVPVVGPLVLFGYQFVVIEHLHLKKPGHYPDFDSGQFSDYLKRGIWPFVAMLLANMLLVPIWIVLSFGPLIIGGCAGVAADQGGDLLGMICALIGFLLIFAFIVIATVGVQLIGTPLSLAAGLAQDLKFAFDMKFIKGFISKVWKDLILAQLLNMLIAWVVMFVGLLLCCVGMYPAISIIVLATAHLNYQFYELYLQRGGTEIPLKPDGV